MKSNDKLNALFICLTITLALLYGITNNFEPETTNSNDYNKDFDVFEPKSSSFWTFHSLIINESGGGNYTWQQASAFLWCEGSGAWNDPYVLENITINGQNSTSCITIADSDAYFIVQNCTLYNGTADLDKGALFLYNVSNGILFKNNISNNNGLGIYLNGTNNITVLNNDVNQNTYSLILDYCNDSKVLQNNVTYNDWLGIYLYESYNNYILGNNVSYTIKDPIYGLGVDLSNSHNNTVENNIIEYNQRAGMSLYQSNNNTIKGNVVYNNSRLDGIFLQESNNNTIVSNMINNNGRDGIRLQIDSNNNTIIGNNASSNINYGIVIDGEGNLIYLNNFSNNNINAEDSGNFNNWDNGSIGNFYSDYVGNDNDKNGIGDTLYGISGSANSNDSYPIIFLDKKAPTIIINKPSPGDLLGSTLPEFEVELEDDHYLNESWYSFDGGLTTQPFSSNGTFEGTLWGPLDNGTITITFYANDTLNNIGSASVSVEKDKIAPNIMIINPANNSIVGKTAPNYDISIDEGNLNETWYSIFNGTDWSDNESITLLGMSGQLNQLLWNDVGNGTVRIKFYANDSLGNLGFSEAVFKKDIIAPNIAINKPSNFTDVEIPNYDLSIDEGNLDDIWVSIYNGTHWSDNYSIPASGQLAAVIWDFAPEASIIIRFYANDTAGNVGYCDVNVTKIISDKKNGKDKEEDGAPSGGIPGYDIFFLISIIGAITLYIYKKRYHNR